LTIVAPNADVKVALVKEYSYFGPLRCWCALVEFTLRERREGNRLFPNAVVRDSIDDGRHIDADCLNRGGSGAPIVLGGSIGESGGSEENEENEYGFRFHYYSEIDVKGRCAKRYGV